MNRFLNSPIILRRANYLCPLVIKRYRWNEWNDKLSDPLKTVNDIKTETIQTSLKQYYEFVNNATEQSKLLKVPNGYKITITTNLNIGVLSISTILEKID